MDRRRFFGNVLGLGAMSAFNFKGFGLMSKNSMDTIDQSNDLVEWNVHFFSSDTNKYPFHHNATYKPDPSRMPKNPLKTYLSHLDKEGIGRGVVVQPEPYGDDHSLLLDSLKKAPDRLRGTSLFYPKDTLAPMKLASLVKAHPEIVATRFHAHRGKESYLNTFSDPGVRALWKQAVDLDIIIELHIGPNYALQVKKAIQTFTGCKVLIDHFAEPHMGDAVEFANVLELADLPNVYMKFSGLGHFADDGPDYPGAKPFTKQVLQAFGPDRMIMGGVSLSTIDVHMENYSQADKAKVSGKNILKLLSWN
ncbi:MAG: amidohydrolase family protein [Cyclobacteriaceae bacterium]|nr:amidohydrolase family protein [Cyclobacteriaceae bacterium SS2]